MVQEAASGCRDTMGSAHIRCSPPQWKGPYTDMMCLTKAAHGGQGGTARKEEKEKISNSIVHSIKNNPGKTDENRKV